ncbi:MAG TPA: YbjN domain-containing protein [Tardiphaga sp.]
MTAPVINGFTLDSLRDQLQQFGYRVELVSQPGEEASFLRSSTAGLAFDIRPGNRLADFAGGFADLAFSAWLKIEGDLPLEVVNRWNTMRRFGRLQLVPGLVVLTMDVSLVGGVMPTFVRAQVELWDHLVQALLPYLREELQKLGPADGTDALPADTKPVEQPAVVPKNADNIVEPVA